MINETMPTRFYIWLERRLSGEEVIDGGWDCGVVLGYMLSSGLRRRWQGKDKTEIKKAENHTAGIRPTEYFNKR